MHMIFSTAENPKGTIRPGYHLLYVTKSLSTILTVGFIVIHFIVQINIDAEGPNKSPYFAYQNTNSAAKTHECTTVEIT